MSGENFGKVRRPQLFGPWGVGAIMPLPDNKSIMIAGLDQFDSKSMDKLADKRLAKYIGVSELLSPKESCVIPAVRFPNWLYCPSCGTMSHITYSNQSSRIRCTNENCKGHPLMVPERFIVVCPDGHIDDFPIEKWVHEGGKCPGPGAPEFERRTQGGSASLGDIVYKCKSCGRKRSLYGATRPGALAEIGYECEGRSPWINKSVGCSCSSSDLRVVQRGGNNVWYADVVSSIFIPDTRKNNAEAIIENKLHRLLEARGTELFDQLIDFIRLDHLEFTKEELCQAFERLIETQDTSLTESDYRYQEYQMLSMSVREKPYFESRCRPANDYDLKELSGLLESVSLIPTITETRAFLGFSRLIPDNGEGRSFYERRKMLSRRPLEWTLGLESIGEGVFLKLNRGLIESWEKNTFTQDRMLLMQSALERSLASRELDARTLNPAYVALHTLAHILILEISSTCGYAASSLRERIYCDKYLEESNHRDMVGLLIYTASGDSEGTMGGLVRCGVPGYFESILWRAYNKARWCSYDPVCIQSIGQGPESCNLAACYNCALLPETSCEIGNKYLDRGLLVGTIDHPDGGLLSCASRTSSMLSVDDDSCPITFVVDFENGFQPHANTFSEMLDAAIENSNFNEQEIDGLQKLKNDGGAIGLEVPYVDVPIASGEDSRSIEVPLVWREARTIYLSEGSTRELEQMFGKECLVALKKDYSVYFGDPGNLLDALKD